MPIKTDQKDFSKKWYLSTEGYYFMYRKDKYDSSLIRATLYRTGDNTIADDTLVSDSPFWGTPGKTHTQVINHFEARLSMNIIR